MQRHERANHLIQEPAQSTATMNGCGNANSKQMQQTLFCHITLTARLVV